jgi:plastocyanin
MKRTFTIVIGAAVVWSGATAMPAAAALDARATAARAPLCTTVDRNVFVLSSGYSPDVQQLTAPGGNVRWQWSTRGADASVTATDIKLFDSGRKTSGAYSFTFFSAGTYRYHSTGPDGQTGSVAVPLCMNGRATAGSGVGIRYASTHHPHWVTDVLVKNPGAAKWSFVAFGATGTELTFTPRRTGTYQFKARLRRTPSNRSSQFSPIHKLTVS